MDIVWYIVAVSMFAQLEKRGPRAGRVLAEGHTANALQAPGVLLTCLRKLHPFILFLALILYFLCSQFGSKSLPLLLRGA